MRLHRRVFVALAVGAGGCSLLIPLDDLTSGRDEGAIEAGDAGNPEIDGTAPPRDASADAPLTANDGGSCDAQFCDDFDEGVLGARWSRSSIKNGATRKIDTTTATSAPNSLAFDLPVSSYAAPAEAVFELDLGAVSRLACTFDVRVDQGPAPDAFEWLDILEFAFEGASGSGVKDGRLIAALHGEHVSFRDDVYFDDAGCGCPRTWPTGPPLTVGTWSQMAFETDFATATLSVDGVPRVAAPLAPIPRGAMRIRFGARNYRPAAWRVHLDSLRCSSS